jgi:SAM-dependent methyltransferase
MENHERIDQYADLYLEEYGFETAMVSARQRLILELLERTRPKVVLEIGCGIDLLAARMEKARVPVAQWIIVEPAERFFDAARSLKMGATRLDVIRGFFEDSVEAVRACCTQAPDLVVCSGLLGEIEQPEALLRAARSLLGPSGVLHVNVANAYSLHRRLARSMGIIESEHQLTERNRRFAQYRVYDRGSLAALAQNAGFRVVEQGGYFIKPFTHAQMQSLGGLISPEMLDGLWTLGRELPELASEIYVNLQLP